MGIPSNVIPEAVWSAYKSIFTDAGFSVMPFIVNAGRVGYTIDFTISHAKPSALTHFMLRWPRMEFTVSELCS